MYSISCERNAYNLCCYWLQQPKRRRSGYIAARDSSFYGPSSAGQEAKEEMDWFCKTEEGHLSSRDLRTGRRFPLQSYDGDELNIKSTEFRSPQISVCSDLNENLDDLKNSQKIENLTKWKKMFRLRSILDNTKIYLRQLSTK